MRRLLYLLFALAFSVSCWSQALRGTTGLLHAPTAEMEKDKTLKIGANYLDLVPLHYFTFNNEISHTYNYYLDLTMFSCLEVAYICTLNYAVHGSHYFPPKSWGKYTNQDRQFSGRIRIWKEGWERWWTPQVVFGIDDASSHVSYGGGDVQIGDGQNNYFTRFYLAATKHLEFENYGILGAHLAYVVGKGKGVGGKFQGPSLGANFRFHLPEGGKGLLGGEKFCWQQLLNSTNLMVEYDARTVNVGGMFSILKDKVNVVAELNEGRYFSGGLFYKIQLK